MAFSIQETLKSIERRRVQFLQNVDKLQKALSHWTRWEAEYEALRTSIAKENHPSAQRMREIARDLSSDLIDEKEIEDLLGTKQKPIREANVIVDLLSRRIDYVRENSATVEKQLDAAEKQLAGVDVLLDPGVENEEGLPMMDILEEVDDQGNEISSSVVRTGHAAAEIVEVLRKAGIQKVEREKGEKIENANVEKPITSPRVKPKTTAAKVEAEPQPQVLNSQLLESDANNAAKATTQQASRSDTVHDMLEHSLPRQEEHDDAIRKPKLGTELRAVELDSDDEMTPSDPVLVLDQSPEDAELLREMLQYGLSENRQVVAELDLDYPFASYSDDEEIDTDYDESEDEYGRSTRPTLTEDYRKEMMELEKRLNARLLENIGPNTDAITTLDHAEGMNTLPMPGPETARQPFNSIKQEASITSAISTTSITKKGVRFVDDTKPPAPTGTRLSRFKNDILASKQAPKQILMNTHSPAPTPSGPSGRTLVTTITEHIPPSGEPAAPNEFDPITVDQELRTAYNKARDKFIQEQGSLKKMMEDEVSPVVEEEGSKPKKVSMFKAGRLRTGGM